MTDHPEIGDELLAHELEANTVVVLIGTHRPNAAMTAWVATVDLDAALAIFDFKETGIVLGLRVNEGGQMFDGQNHRIEAHKYLGKI
jgi:hypothetical protein